MRLISFVVPARNEQKSLPFVLNEIKETITANSLNAEIIVADNQSHDATAQIAADYGATVINVAAIGYGSALAAGFAAARGEYIIMGDADGSYDFHDTPKILQQLDAGSDMAVGNRFGGNFNNDSMPLINRYIGNPILTFLGKFVFAVPINDFHCGLRGFKREHLQALALQTKGMEFASEMIVSARLNNLKITEFNTTLRKDLRDGKSHLDPWRDGWRHLFFIIFATPHFIFLKYSVPLYILTTICFASIYFSDIELFGITFSNLTLFYLQFPMIFSFILILSACVTSTIESPRRQVQSRLMKTLSRFDFRIGFLSSLFLLSLALYLTYTSLNFWGSNSYGKINSLVIIKDVILSSALFLKSITLGCFSLLIGYLYQSK